jgi:8-oxo-dGTP diphosphatase
MSDKKYCYKYPRPALTTDCVVFSFVDETLSVLLIQRGNEPFKGKWAFPGGFVNMDETTEHGAARELEEETGLTDIKLEQVYTFSEPNRDPRHRTVSVAYFALIKSKQKVWGGDDAAKAKWFPLKELPDLAFDHDEITRVALKKLHDKIDYYPLDFEQFSSKEITLVKENISSLKLI